MVLEKIKNKLALLFCRIVNGQNIIKEMKTIKTVQRKTHKMFLEFLNGMYSIFVKGNGNKEHKSRKRESIKQKASSESQISMFFL